MSSAGRYANQPHFAHYSVFIAQMFLVMTNQNCQIMKDKSKHQERVQYSATKPEQPYRRAYPTGNTVENLATLTVDLKVNYTMHLPCTVCLPNLVLDSWSFLLLECGHAGRYRQRHRYIHGSANDSVGLLWVLADFRSTLHILWRFVPAVTFLPTDSTLVALPQMLGLFDWLKDYTVTKMVSNQLAF